MGKQIKLGIVMLVAGLLTACGGDDNNSESQSPTTANATVENTTTFSVELTGVKVKDKTTGEIMVVDSAGINSGTLIIQ